MSQYSIEDIQCPGIGKGRGFNEMVIAYRYVYIGLYGREWWSGMVYLASMDIVFLHSIKLVGQISDKILDLTIKRQNFQKCSFRPTRYNWLCTHRVTCQSSIVSL